MVEWVKLLGGIIAFLGPGFCIITILYKDSLKSLTQWFVFSLAVSVCFWGVLLAWLKLFNIRINLPGVWFLFLSGWLVGFIYLILNRSSIKLERFSIKLHEVVIWILSATSGLIILWSLRFQVAGLGSDSYHHTLIAQLIHDNGGLPNNYQPATDQLISFSYHYGYHAAMAALMWLSGWESRLLVLASGALLVMVSTLSIALLAEELTERPIAGIVAGAFIGFVIIFPMYFLNWGRYPQLAALALFPVFLQMIIANFKDDNRSINFRKIILFALVAAGIAITHYRVTIMAALAVILLVVFIRKNDKYSLKNNFRFLLPLLLIAGLALLFFGPWLWQVIQSHQVGYSIRVADIDASYYSIKRLDSNAIGYPTNIIVILFTISGLVWGGIKKKWYIIWMTIWAGSMLLLSGPKLFSGLMDRISVIISLYLPIAIIVGWIVEEIYTRVNASYRKVVVTLFLLILIWSGYVAINKNLVGTGFVTPEDLDAAQWIKTNTPDDAYFMVNTYKFGFSSNFVIGIDAGYWLPLIANRRTVTIPMIFDVEMFRQPDGLNQLLGFYNLGADLTTPKAVDYLEKEKVSYVYIGEQGGQIDVNLLVISDNYSLVYQKDHVYVFQTEY